MGAPAAVIDFEQEKAKRFLEDLKDNPFLAVVAYADGTVKVFDKDIGPDELQRIREALSDAFTERKADGKP